MYRFDIDDPRETSFPFVYRGIVEHNIDPLKSGRVKLRIFGIHSDNINYVKTEALPWATPSTSIGHGGARSIGNYEVPPIGAHLYCFFEMGDHNYPVYFACAPAIEDMEDYQQKEGKLESRDKDANYEYEVETTYDDRETCGKQGCVGGDGADTKERFETPKHDQIKHPVPDWCEPTRANIHSEKSDSQDKPEALEDPNEETDKEFEGRHIFPKEFFCKKVTVAFEGDLNSDTPGYCGDKGAKPGKLVMSEEDDRELKVWDERKWGHNDCRFQGCSKWSPKYPLVSTFRNMQGEIEDRDVLKARYTYIHPSKYYEELVQLDAGYEFDDFLNEKSVKFTYEAQRGYQNHKDEKENELDYYDNDGNKVKRNPIKRFEKRVHNPGRERTVNEDIVYRYFQDKVNITYHNPFQSKKADLNVYFEDGNSNLEIKKGDINTRLHEGHINTFIDEGNITTTQKNGDNRLYIDEGYQHMVIRDKREWGNVVKYEPPKGDHWIDLKEGNQKFELDKGNQHFELKNGNMSRNINGNYTKKITDTLSNTATNKIINQTEAVQSKIILKAPEKECEIILEAPEDGAVIRLSAPKGTIILDTPNLVCPCPCS